MSKRDRAILGVLFFVTAYAAPGAIKNTATILKDEHKDLALIHGVVAFDSGLIQHMYDYGALGKRGDKIESETIKLVHKLFHRPPESTSSTGFLVTKPVRELPHNDVAAFVAAEIAFLKRLPEQDCFKKYLEKRECLREFMATLNKNEQDKKKARLLEKNLAEARRAAIKAFDESLEHPPYESPLKELAHYPIKAFLECSASDYLSQVMPQTILQAMLYKKTDGDRTAMRTYYEWLNARLHCLKESLPLRWEDDVFTTEQREALAQEMATVSPTEAYERTVFLSLLPTDHPSLISYGDATFSTACFTDCMETTLRNLTNFLAYNPQTGLFESSLIEQRLGVKVHEKVKRFYNRFADPTTAAQRNAHDAWAEILSSLPNHLYCRAIPPISHQKKDCVKINQETSALISHLKKTAGVALPLTAVTYDMRPSIRNFMLACDYLFGLRLFEDLSENAWAEDGFIKTYLPRVLKSLHVSVPETLDYGFLELNDGAKESLFLPLTFSDAGDYPYTFSLIVHTEYDDGEILLPHTQSTLAVPTDLVNSGDNPLQGKTAEEVLSWLFTQDISESTMLYARLQQIPVFNENILALLLWSAQTYIKETEQSLAILRLYSNALARGLMSNESVVKDAVENAVKALHNGSTLARNEAVYLLKEVCEQKCCRDEIAALLQKDVQSDDSRTLSATVALCTALADTESFKSLVQATAKKLATRAISLPMGLRFEISQLEAMTVNVDS